jgi:hypothetical protein
MIVSFATRLWWEKGFPPLSPVENNKCFGLIAAKNFILTLFKGGTK